MELLEGEDSSTRLAARFRLPPREAAAIVIQVARALRRAAEAAIVHRDLKPSNVFIVRGDDDEGGEVVKVLDFGVAKAPRITLVGETTKSGTIMGSPRYMSPEQARASEAVDHRSDLWSLAVIAYRALTGARALPRRRSPGARPPHLRRPASGRRRRSRPTSAPPSTRSSSGPSQPDPAQRFQTARAFAAAFAAAAGEELPPPSTRLSRDERPAGETSARTPPSRVPSSPARGEAPEAPPCPRLPPRPRGWR